jgi:hypothetical protein
MVADIFSESILVFRIRLAGVQWLEFYLSELRDVNCPGHSTGEVVGSLFPA